MDYFFKYGVSQEDVKVLKKLNSSKNFEVVDKTDFQDMLEYFEQYRVYENLLPILTDHNSNYWCLYIDGALKGMVCYLSHQELSLEPKFQNIENLVNALEQNQNFDDFSKPDKDFFDFPSKGDTTFLESRKNLIQNLFETFKRETEEEVRQQIAYAIMALSLEQEIEQNIYPFLDNEDMYVQERAIDMLAFHQYAPARAKLIELIKTAMPNGQSAASRAVKVLNKKQ